ncbi:MAG: cardiolipin synthase B [Deltaproteobacteria bacterium]|nr:cardiolipin synthase B [Deltaproteobacteria bacterium]
MEGVQTFHRLFISGKSPAINHQIMDENSFRQTLEKVAQTSFLSGNSIQVLKDGVSAFEVVFRAIDAAERMACLEFYIFRDDQTGWELAELLARKRREGVRIYLIYDHFGSLSTTDRFWRFLKTAGVEIRPFHPPRLMNPNMYFHRNHRKLVVVDGRVAFTGGLNVGDEYHGFRKKKVGGWRDTGVMVQGPAAAFMLKKFLESWKECGGARIHDLPAGAGRNQEQDKAVLPLFSSSRKSIRSLRQLLQFSVHAAKKSVHLTMAYFIPSWKFLKVLLKAARRGVDVKIILPGQTDLRIVAYVSRTYYKTLLREGAQIYHYQPRVLHAKTLVFDGIWNIVGSANLDARSLNYNYECGVGILDRELGNEMEEMFCQDLKDSTPITEEDQSRWPLHERALGTFFSWFRSYL